MTPTLRCQRCGTPVPIFRSALVERRLLIPSHECSRVLVAECWKDGAVIRRWTSETPGVTGPWNLVRMHAEAADLGWSPPAGPLGWTYHWQSVTAL